MRRRWPRDHTMNAFIGRFTRSSPDFADAAFPAAVGDVTLVLMTSAYDADDGDDVTWRRASSWIPPFTCAVGKNSAHNPPKHCAQLAKF